MKLTTISRGFYSLLFSFSVFAFSFFAMASVALAVDFSASFSPSADTVAQDVTTAITISFDRAVYVDTAETAFTGTTLATVVSLHATDAAGDAIPFSASISADNTVITIDPTADLPEGAVYVAITDAYYDSAGNQGDAATATFTVTAPAPTPTVVEDQSAGTTPTDTTPAAETPPVDTPPAETPSTDVAPESPSDDTTPPAVTSDDIVVTSSPADRAVVTDNAVNITLTFDRAVYQDMRGTPFTTKDLASFVVLRTDDVYGYGIPFEASMSDDNTVMTIDPNDVLSDGEVYVAISADYYDVDAIRGVAFDATFAVDTGNPASSFDDFFSHFLTPLFLADMPEGPTVFGVSTPLIQLDEELREAKIAEALSLLWRALESLSVVVAMDSIDATSSAALTVEDDSTSDDTSASDAATVSGSVTTGNVDDTPVPTVVE